MKTQQWIFALVAASLVSLSAIPQADAQFVPAGQYGYANPYTGQRTVTQYGYSPFTGQYVQQYQTFTPYAGYSQGVDLYSPYGAYYGGRAIYNPLLRRAVGARVLSNLFNGQYQYQWYGY